MRTGYALSLLLNAALVCVVVARWRTRPAVATPPPAAPAPAAAALVNAASSPPVDPVRIGGNWRNWIEPLRRARVPPEVLAGLITADFDRRWQTRQSELQQRYMRGEIDADGLAAAGLEHDAELQREMQAALGPDQYRAWDMGRVLQGLNVSEAQLSDAERDTVYELERDLRDRLRQAELDKLQGTIDPGTFTARQQSEQDAVARKLRALLGEHRAAQLQGADDTIGAVKRAMSDVPLAPAQIDALAQVERQWNRTRSDLVTLEVNTQDPALEDQIRANDEQRRAAFEQIAGPAVFDRYVKSQDSRYEDLRRNATRWGIAPANVEQVYATIKNFEDAVQAYSHDADLRGVDPATRDVAIGGLQRETERSLASEVGAQAYDHLKRNGVGLVAAP